MDIKELKDIALELMDALAAKKLGEVELELDDAKIKIKAAEPAPVIAAAQTRHRQRSSFRQARRSRARWSARFILLRLRTNRRSCWSVSR